MYDENVEPMDICNYHPTKEETGEIDLLWNSSPCQDFSTAGKGAGGAEGSGTRSSLIYEVVRIIKEVRPRYVVWENVRGLLSKKHKPILDDYIERLAELGYRSYYQVLNAKDYGIPQNRERVFTVSILDGDDYKFPEGEECTNKIISYTVGKHQQDLVQDEEGLCRCIPGGTHGSTPHLLKTIVRDFQFPPKQELKLKLKDMLETEVDEKYYLSDEQIDKIKVNAITRENSKDADVLRKYGIFDTEKSTHQAGSVYDENGLSPTLDTMQGGWRQPCIEIKGNYVNKKYEKFIDKNGYVPEMFNPYNEKEIKDVAPTQSTCCGSTTSSATVLIKNKRLNSLIEKTDFEEGKVLNLDLYNQRTNENISQCLTEPHHNSQRLFDGFRIRKLTPKECWRLMGFDDEDFEKARRVNSDTQLYKQAGNSVVVNVIEAIFDNLLKEYQ